MDGLAEAAMHRVMAPSGWTITQLLNHLAFDDEMFVDRGCTRWRRSRNRGPSQWLGVGADDRQGSYQRL
ncbi:hypothetical protein LWF01_18870 [Saxibacter everestensis]|uniref:Mycothiol-dependent maleylpyruvate isomerase metal-binding domain-containing protein n=1 Tax=Saxibacter everestensis TaxID=2909229 RepID=A0ABY8R156_9MICO|nr:hypothetical protein LWF01_18870 [Brevibacteriaceae bacterium ZFBP1038]